MRPEGLSQFKKSTSSGSEVLVREIKYIHFWATRLKKSSDEQKQAYAAIARSVQINL
jgi:hypothetical protein